jgi:hypothetical protein
MNNTKTAWLQAEQDKRDFYMENAGTWTDEVDATYRELRDKSDRLYYEMVSAKTGKSVEEVTYAVNEAMHSRFD